MAKPPRDHCSSASNTYSITAASWQHRAIFNTDRMASLLLKTLSDYRNQGKFLLHEFVIMPDHIHLLITPTGITLERAMQFIKGGFSYRVKKALGLTIEIWERGYVDHRLRDAADYQQHVRYIHENPVKPRIVALPEQFQYSSACGGVPLDPCPRGLKPETVIV